MAVVMTNSSAINGFSWGLSRQGTTSWASMCPNLRPNILTGLSP